MKQRTQAGVGVHCRQSHVITEYMENTLPTDVDIWSIGRFVILFAFVDYVYCIFGGHLIYLKLCGCVLIVISAPANVLGRLQCQALRAMEYCTFSYNLTVAYHVCVQPTVDYIGVPRTVGVVWVCRRFDHKPFCVFSPVLSIAALACYFCVGVVYFQPSECVAQASAPGSCKLHCPLVTTGDVISRHYQTNNARRWRHQRSPAGIAVCTWQVRWPARRDQLVLKADNSL